MSSRFRQRVVVNAVYRNCSPYFIIGLIEETFKPESFLYLICIENVSFLYFRRSNALYFIIFSKPLWWHYLSSLDSDLNLYKKKKMWVFRWDKLCTSNCKFVYFVLCTSNCKFVYFVWLIQYKDGFGNTERNPEFWFHWDTSYGNTVIWLTTLLATL